MNLRPSSPFFPILIAALALSASVFNQAFAEAGSHQPMGPVSLAHVFADSSCDFEIQKKTEEFLSDGYWKQYSETLTPNHNRFLEIGNRYHFAGIPKRSAEILRDQGFIESFEFDAQNGYRLDYRVKSGFSMKEFVLDLNRLSRETHQKTYGSQATDYQRLVFVILAFEGTVENATRIFPVLYDPEGEQYYSEEGERIQKPKILPVALRKDDQGNKGLFRQTQISRYLKLSSMGLSLVGEPLIAKHDILGHFFSNIKFPELTRLHRKKMFELSQDPALGDSIGGTMDGTNTVVRAIITDEFNFCSIRDEVLPHTQKLGTLILPNDLKTTQEWGKLLRLGYMGKKFSLKDLEDFVDSLMEHRDSFFNRFGGGATDGYNDGRLNVSHFKKESPFHQIAESHMILRNESDDPSTSLDIRALQAIKPLSLFLAASRNRISLRELIENAFYITDFEAFKKTDSYRFFKNVYGGEKNENEYRRYYVDPEAANP